MTITEELATLESAPAGRLIDMSAEQYHADPGAEPSLSSSIAKLIADRSLAHAYAAHPRLGGKPSRSSDAMDEGTLIHKLVLGRGIDLAIVEADNWRTKAAQEARDAARGAGKLPVLARVHDEAQTAAERILANLREQGVELTGASEVACIWREETTSGPIWCRGLLDHVIEERGLIYDLKKARSAHPRACEAHVCDYGYDIQHAAYTRGLTRARPELAGRVEMRFLFVETEEPYAVLVGRLDGQFREYGERRWIDACERWGRALRTGNWPAYADEPVFLSPPGWLLSTLENDE